METFEQIDDIIVYPDDFPDEEEEESGAVQAMA